jgi:Uma2 family endonuclease
MIDLAPERIRITSAAFRQLPETNQIQELIDGEVIVSPALHLHQQIVGFIHFFLMTLLRGRGILCLAPTGLTFEEGHDYEPDLFWISPENTHCILDAEGRWWHGGPDLIIEVLSPTTASRDFGTKYLMYEKHGVREYWIVDPSGRFLQVFQHNGQKFERLGSFAVGEQFTSAVLGADVPVTSLFPPASA